MKGRIVVESEPGKGSVFTVYLPAKVTTPDTAQTEKPNDLATTSVEKSSLDTILVIDDDAAVRDLMSRFLSRLGFHVITAASGDEGLRLAKQFNPLVITLDVVMPQCDGWAVLKKLKADPALAEIPVIMVTVVDNETMGIELGADNYLIKPVDRDRLAVLIEKHRMARTPGVTEAEPLVVSNRREASSKRERVRSKAPAGRNNN
jgi:DNA-binding response OmpR family regulator